MFRYDLLLTAPWSYRWHLDHVRLTIKQVHYQQKALLTQASSGGSGGEAQSGRTAPQVYANSLPATFLILLDLYMRKTTAHNNSISGLLLPIGIICSYAAATADTLSSELGILSSSTPFLITQPWRKVPRGTNGGVTVLGLLWGLFGGFLIAVAAVILAPRPLPIDDVRFVAGISVAGLFGSVVDSALGALVQATVEDKATGKVVEGENGKRVLVGDGGSRVQRGMDLFNNNGVNFLMTSMTAAVGMAVALAYLR